MYLLYCDETNFERSSSDFFVYGGIAIETSKAAALSVEIENLRSSLGVPREYILKFNPGPKDFSHEQFIELKQGVIRAAHKYECKLFVNLLLHDIATSSEEARRFGINTLCYHFDCFLNRPKMGGLVLIDRFDDKQIDGQLKEKLSIGLSGKLPYSSEIKIDYILGYHYAAVGQSHFCSIVDVLLGSLRFAVNAFTRNNEQHIETAQKLLNQMAPLFFRESGEKVHEISLCFSPKEIRKQDFKDKYIALKDFLTANGIRPAQSF